MFRHVLFLSLALPLAAAAEDGALPATDDAGAAAAGTVSAVETPVPTETGAETAAETAAGEVAGEALPGTAAAALEETAPAISAPAAPAVSVETQDGRETVVMLADVLFPFGESGLRPEAEAALREAAKKIEGHEGVVIEGHTDDVGSSAYNTALGRARAEAVRDWLVSAGLDGAAFEIVSRGESAPKIPNRSADGEDLPENRAQNRRVVFVLPEAQ